MVKCTQCNSELEEDFGLVTCQNCGAQLAVQAPAAVSDTSAESGAPPTPS